jgi:hypothetical protein
MPKCRTTKVRKLTAFYPPTFKRWLLTAADDELAGLDSALVLIAAIQRISLTGRHVGFNVQDKLLLPEVLRPAYKYFLGGWCESDDLLDCVKRASRIEFTPRRAYRGVAIDIRFVEKAQDVISQWEFSFSDGDGHFSNVGYVSIARGSE